MVPGRCAFAAAMLLAVIAFPVPGAAQQLAMLRSAALGESRAPLIRARNPAPEAGLARNSASLFIGKRGASLFAPLPRRPDRAIARLQPLGLATPAAHILNLIARAEAGRHGYDAVQLGAKIRPPAKPTDLTLQQIYDWIARTPGQHHAIGRYQFIPATLKHLVARAGLDAGTVFSPRVQDQLANLLLADAGLGEVAAGDIGRHAFMNNLARIWAGLPTSDGTSYYHGLAGNRATMTWAQFDAEMGRIFPG